MNQLRMVSFFAIPGLNVLICRIRGGIKINYIKEFS
jgi:hypothetical protein